MSIARFAAVTMIALLLPLAPAAADPSPPRSLDTFKGVSRAKAVWDITTGDEKTLARGIGLIGRTAEMLRKRGIEPEFILLIRGPATKIVAKSRAGTAFASDKTAEKDLERIREQLRALQKSGTKVEVCAIATKGRKISPGNIHEMFVVEDNVFENLIVLQNKGYAYMPLH
ncbi:MAG: DsrE family protein [Hyphomicrobiaceae bacterium]|nr:DsrE family protein [Hyphomicrobiaceae bacterium]